MSNVASHFIFFYAFLILYLFLWNFSLFLQIIWILSILLYLLPMLSCPKYIEAKKILPNMKLDFGEQKKIFFKVYFI